MAVARAGEEHPPAVRARAEALPAKALSSDELAAELAPILGADARIVRRRPFAYSTSFAIEELGVVLVDGRRLDLLLKDLGSPSDLARVVKPSFLYEPLREIDVYTGVLDGRGLGTAECYGTLVDQEAGRYWLLLEHVAGVPLRQTTFATWHEVAGWLASMHASCQGLARPSLIQYDDGFYETWLQRALQWSADRRLHGLARSYEAVVERLVRLPRTLVHGELYPANVLVDRRGDGTRVCVVDWETAAIGPGLVDLAAFTSGTWPEEVRGRAVAAYYYALPSPPPEAEFLHALECCRLHVALQWLGWATDWTPPRRHRTDWTAAALRAAANLGL